MIKRYILALMSMAILIGVISISPVSAQTSSATYVIDFEGLAEGAIISEVSCGAGISSCPPEGIGGTVLVNAHNPNLPGSPNAAMIFDAECVGGCSGRDFDLNFPGHGNTLIVSENLVSSDPDDADVTNAFIEFDFSGFTGTVTIVSIDAGDIEVRESINAFIEFHDGSCDEQHTREENATPMPITGDHAITNVLIGRVSGVSDAQCLHVHLNGSGTVDNIRFTITDTPGTPAIDIEKTTNGVQADGRNDGEIPRIAPGQTVTWEYTVTNTGSVALQNVVVFDDNGTTAGLTPPRINAGDGDPDNVLSPGEVWIYQFATTAETLANTTSGVAIVNGCGSPPQPTYENMGRVTAVTNDTAATPVMDEDPSHYCNPPGEPGIHIEKVTNGQDADNPASAPPTVPEVAPDGSITWRFTVTNTGDVPLANVYVNDDNGTTGITSDDFSPTFISGDTNGDTLLDLTETWIFEATGAALDLSDPQDTAGVTIMPGCGSPPRNTYENTGRVTAVTNDAAATQVEDADLSHYCNTLVPGITIEKKTNGEDADDANDADVPQIAVGDPITWTYAVTNTGGVLFAEADVAVEDDIIGEVTTIVSQGDGDAVLSPGETWTYQATGVALDLGSNPAGVTLVDGCNPGGTPDRPAYQNLGVVTAPGATDQDPSHYCNPPGASPALARVTGGGWRVTGSDGVDVRSSGGFTLHCDITLSNNLQINWGQGNKWHINKFVDAAFCKDDPEYTPEPPDAPADTYFGLDVGRLNNTDGSVACFKFEDHGERSGDPDGPDQALIRIWEVGFDPGISAEDLDDPGFDCLVSDSDPSTDSHTVLFVPESNIKGNFQFHEDQPHKKGNGK